MMLRGQFASAVQRPGCKVMLVQAVQPNLSRRVPAVRLWATWPPRQGRAHSEEAPWGPLTTTSQQA
eukprot:6830997-Alexandrium_andersonii.AAC.1